MAQMYVTGVFFKYRYQWILELVLYVIHCVSVRDGEARGVGLRISNLKDVYNFILRYHVNRIPSIPI